LLIIPEEIFLPGLFDKLNEMKRIVRSKNGQLIMCGRVVIQLDLDCNDFKNIGVIWLKTKLPKTQYEFLSLINDNHISMIQHIIKKDPKSLVKFDDDMKPVTPHNRSFQHLCYMANIIENQNMQVSSIIKINTWTMAVQQIYFSEFRIIHLSIKEFQSKIEDLEEKINTDLKRGILKRINTHGEDLKTPTTRLC
jgi:hypothetical protein